MADNNARMKGKMEESKEDFCFKKPKLFSASVAGSKGKTQHLFHAMKGPTSEGGQPQSLGEHQVTGKNVDSQAYTLSKFSNASCVLPGPSSQRPQTPEEFDIFFVGEVEKRPVLYDYMLDEYSQKDCSFSKIAWKEVAMEVKLTVDECKEKWRILKITLEKKLKPSQTGVGSRRGRQYYLYDAMKFALPFINVPQRPDENEVNEDSQMFSETSNAPGLPVPSSQPPPTPPPLVADQPEPFPRKSITSEEYSATDNALAELFLGWQDEANPNSPADERKEGIKQFVLSLTPDMALMTNAQLRVFKLGILNAIEEVLGADFPTPQMCLMSASRTPLTSDSEPANERKEGIKQFVLSLTPGMALMTNAQLRVFKLGILNAIEEVLGADFPTPEMCLMCASRTPLTSDSEPANERKEGIKQFVLSLKPDMALMTNAQLKAFKLEILNAVEGVLGADFPTPEMCLMCASRTPLSSDSEPANELLEEPNKHENNN